VTLEIVEERRPVERQTVFLEVLQWKRKTVVDADQCRRPLGEPCNQPFGDSSACPLFAWTRGRQDFVRGIHAIGGVDAQTLEARRGRLSVGIVDADVTVEIGSHGIMPTDERHRIIKEP